MLVEVLRRISCYDLAFVFCFALFFYIDIVLLRANVVQGFPQNCGIVLRTFDTSGIRLLRSAVILAELVDTTVIIEKSLLE